MTVEELMSVLGEMDQNDLIVIGLCNSRGATEEFRVAHESVYQAIVDVEGVSRNAVVIDTSA